MSWQWFVEDLDDTYLLIGYVYLYTYLYGYTYLLVMLWLQTLKRHLLIALRFNIVKQSPNCSRLESWIIFHFILSCVEFFKWLYSLYSPVELEVPRMWILNGPVSPYLVHPMPLTALSISVVKLRVISHSTGKRVPRNFTLTSPRLGYLWHLVKFLTVTRG